MESGLASLRLLHIDINLASSPFLAYSLHFGVTPILSYSLCYACGRGLMPSFLRDLNGWSSPSQLKLTHGVPQGGLSTRVLARWVRLATRRQERSLGVGHLYGAVIGAANREQLVVFLEWRHLRFLGLW